jgi:hypothetical protein
MIKPIPLLFLGILLNATHAKGTELVAIEPDPVSGRMIKTIYTKYYDAGVWLLPGRVGLSIVVDQEGEYRGKVTTYVWNRDKEAHAIKFLTISIHDRNMHLDQQFLNAVPDERSGLAVGQAEVLNMAKHLVVNVTYEIDGAEAATELKLERRTRKDMKKYFGKDGKPPYPWYHD